MTAPIGYLNLEQVLELHQLVVAKSGGSAQVLRPELLESALAQPPMIAFGQEAHPDLPAKAAAYLFHICKNHPLEDGNKRTAFAAAEVFLRLNGHRISGTVDELEDLVLGVADGRTSKDGLIADLRQRVVPLAPSP